MRTQHLLPASYVFWATLRFCGLVLLVGQANPLPTIILMGHLGQQLGRPTVAHLHPEI
jgi:hypothetical protein